MARQQLKPVQNAAHNARWKVLKECFAAQIAQIIEGFHEGQSTATVNPLAPPKTKNQEGFVKKIPRLQVPGTPVRSQYTQIHLLATLVCNTKKLKECLLERRA